MVSACSGCVMTVFHSQLLPLLLFLKYTRTKHSQKVVNGKRLYLFLFIRLFVFVCISKVFEKVVIDLQHF